MAATLGAASAAQAAPLYVVKDVNPGMSDGLRLSTAIVANGDHVVFWGTDPVSGIVGNPWRSDGTDLGTMLVKPIMGSAGFFRGFGASYDGFAYFEANDGFAGFEQVWRTDGTAAGTIALTPHDLTVSGVGPSGLRGASPSLWFTGRSSAAASSRSLWRSDGSAAGTLVTPPGNRAGEMGLLGDRVIMVGDPAGSISSKLYTTDGTLAGSVELSTNFTAALNTSAQVNGRLYFAASDATNGNELWRTDGTVATTGLVKNLMPAAASSNPQLLTRVDDRVFFTALDNTAGRELWVSDGTDPGTLRVKDIRNGLQDAQICCLSALNDKLLFFADDGISGVELWRSDGTEAGTVMVKDINAGPGGAATIAVPSAVMGDRLEFVANNGSGARLWRTDGSPTSTVMTDATLPVNATTRLVAANGHLFMQVLGPSQGNELGALDEIQQFGQTWCSAPESPIRDESTHVYRIKLPPGTSMLGLSVSVDLYHSYVGDLALSLKHVDTGTTVSLLNRPKTTAAADCAADLIDIRFDDGSAAVANTNCAAAGARLAYARDSTWKSVQPLSVFAGQNFGGTWELTVQDAAEDDSGVLHQWCLRGKTDALFGNGFE